MKLNQAIKQHPCAKMTTIFMTKLIMECKNQKKIKEHQCELEIVYIIVTYFLLCILELKAKILKCRFLY